MTVTNIEINKVKVIHFIKFQPKIAVIVVEETFSSNMDKQFGNYSRKSVKKIIITPKNFKMYHKILI